MSQISKALRKSQEIRENNEGRKAREIVYLSDAPQVMPTFLLVFFSVGIVAAIVISISAMMLTIRNSDSKQVQVLGLEKTVQLQERKINNLSTHLNNIKNVSVSQIHILNDRLKREVDSRKAQNNNVISVENSHYDNLKEAILDDKQEISYLDNLTKKLEQKIEELSASNTQVN